MKKVLIIGSKGMAGHMIRHVLLESRNMNVIDISRGNLPFESTYDFDLRDLTRLDEVLSLEQPDVVINCVGILNEDAESDPEKGVFINALLPHFVAKRCDRLLHISTDCVFSGMAGNYIESSEKDGKGFYAESKSLGEVTYGSHLTLRTSIIGPELKPNGKGLLHWFLNQSDEVKGYSKAIWSGVTTLQLARAIEKLIFDPEITGLVHYTNSVKISKLALLELIAQVFDRATQVTPYNEYTVDKSLINTRSELGIVIPNYNEMLTELAAFMSQYRSSVYKQYYNN